MRVCFCLPKRHPDDAGYKASDDGKSKKKKDGHDEKQTSIKTPVYRVELIGRHMSVKDQAVVVTHLCRYPGQCRERHLTKNKPPNQEDALLMILPIQQNEVPDNLDSLVFTDIQIQIIQPPCQSFIQHHAQPRDEHADSSPASQWQPSVDQ